MNVNERFDTAKTAGQRGTTEPRQRDWQVRLPIIVTPLPTDGSLCRDGRTRYEWNSIARRINGRNVQMLTLRRFPPKVRGKAAAKAAKRARRKVATP